MKRIIYKFLRYLNYLIILGLLLSYLSVYVNPGRIWILAFFGLAYPFLLIANVVFIIFWISKKKKIFIIPLLAILLGWNFLSSLIQFPIKKHKSTTEETKTFKILSYNVRLFDLYDWRKESKNTTEEIFRFINSEKPDIICFQEFYTKNNNQLSEKYISNALENQYYSHIDYTIQNNTANYGIATYSKYPIINKGVIQFKNSTNTSIYTDVLVDKDTIRVFNNHLQSIRFNRNNYSFISNSKSMNDDRMKEIMDISYRLRDAFIKRAEQSQIVSNHVKNAPYPVFICGDFNDVPVSYTYHVISKGLKDSFMEAGEGIGNTYIGKFPSFRIDYILHNKSITCHEFEIKKVKLSDHYPIVGEFSVD